MSQGFVYMQLVWNVRGNANDAEHVALRTTSQDMLAAIRVGQSFYANTFLLTVPGIRLPIRLRGKNIRC